ncbi:hypothetical protein [Terribacillus saccharophilus]|uniref:hypothetical protein n=1 Tax=Terribacillus saccharophilus TaxID=361277 RepID=UPI002989DD05|nr:hypothetical protein [Terribacillus saccharophilus]MCM3227494.1 hypothetical protein [Terribacillus saccharophilus]
MIATELRTFGEWKKQGKALDVSEFVSKMENQQLDYIRPIGENGWTHTEEMYLYHLAEQIRIKMDWLQSGKLDCIAAFEEDERKQKDYNEFLSRIKDIVEGEFNFTEDEFYSLQETAVYLEGETK